MRLTGHRSLRIKPGVPIGPWDQVETEFEKALAGFSAEDFSARVLERAADQVGARQGWTLPAEGQKAEAVMLIMVENICVCAPDALSEVEVKLALKVVLTESGSEDVLWRDCLDWSFAGLYSSLRDLIEAEAAQQEELFSDLVTRMLGRLAEHLASRVPRG